jgi:predicted house-cleaning noncanonical NTP pyrophosphatase (MazG superfamily)
MTQAKTHSIGRGLTFLDKLYNKAIRDKIPEIIKIKGEKYELRRLTNTEFLPELEKKLHEELAEYDQNKSSEELADILEVVYRIAELRGISRQRWRQFATRRPKIEVDLKKTCFW